MTRTALALAALVLAAGCHAAVWHRPLNAPGHIDVTAPPADPTRQVAERPEDPGEELLVVSGGALGGGGLRVDGDGGHGLGWLSGEVSLHRGTRARSHYGDDFFVYPDRALGVNLGFTFLENEDLTPATLYVEAERTTRTVVGLAAGVALDPRDLAAGPQLTVSASTLYVRAAYLYDRGFELQFGMVIKLPALWVWSR